ncbi:hypothetical protein WT25_20215 [Burkholderia territorii]|nr:hypothetical protein WT25_20215 [Burkholderia territorii]
MDLHAVSTEILYDVVYRSESDTMQSFDACGQCELMTPTGNSTCARLRLNRFRHEISAQLPDTLLTGCAPVLWKGHGRHVSFSP